MLSNVQIICRSTFDIRHLKFDWCTCQAWANIQVLLWVSNTDTSHSLRPRLCKTWQTMSRLQYYSHKVLLQSWNALSCNQPFLSRVRAVSQVIFNFWIWNSSTIKLIGRCMPISSHQIKGTLTAEPGQSLPKPQRSQPCTSEIQPASPSSQ